MYRDTWTLWISSNKAIEEEFSGCGWVLHRRYCAGRDGSCTVLRWAPERTEVEAWEGRIFTGVPKKWEFSAADGCDVTAAALFDPGKEARLPGPHVRSGDLLGWAMLLHTPTSWIWLFWGALRGEQVFPALVSCVVWVVWGTCRTAWAVATRCRCPHSYGSGPAVGPKIRRFALGSFSRFCGGPLQP